MCVWVHACLGQVALKAGTNIVERQRTLIYFVSMPGLHFDWIRFYHARKSVVVCM